MNDTRPFKLKNAPIIEAMLRIDCDLPPTKSIVDLEKVARDTFRATYPKFRPIFVHEHRVNADPINPLNPPVSITNQGVHGFQFVSEDQKQIVQVRSTGYSFHPLAPYSSLDDYVSEMRRTWELFVDIVSPVVTRLTGLRYINRMPLPLANGTAELADYFKICPRLPNENRLEFAGFLNQHMAVEKGTGNQANIVLASRRSG